MSGETEIIRKCDENFLMKALSAWTRIDERAFLERRETRINFGKEWGCCYASLGKTKVVAKVSCTLETPNTRRPHEGILTINLELNSMADPYFDSEKQSNESTQYNRFLEKGLKESNAVDLESLCIKVGELVWEIRVDINVLNNEGNILECASIAALGALIHSKRPDVTYDGEDYKINEFNERDPISTALYHYPLCLTYAIFDEGKYIIADPCRLEEKIAPNLINAYVNAHQEICAVHIEGKICPDILLDILNKSACKVDGVVDLIKNAIEKDKEDRLNKGDAGFHTNLNIEEKAIPISALKVCLDEWISVSNTKKKKKLAKKQENTTDEQPMNWEINVEETATSSGKNPKREKLKVEDMHSDDDDEMTVDKPKKEDATRMEDSEEEEVVILNANKKSNRKTKKKKNLH